MLKRSMAQGNAVQAAITLIVCGALLAAAPAGLAQSGLPQLGDGQEMSVAAERKLGQRIARDIFRDPDYIDDPVVGDYVQRIWQPLMAAATARGDIPPELAERFAWQVLLARDRSVNAFALPGGYLGLHLGLIAIVGNRDELASVLAHELSHVSQRHIARITSLQNQQAPWLLGAMILGALAARKNIDVASAVVTTAQAASIQNQLNFSRDMEREADRIGYQVLEQAQFNVQGFVGMFDKLALANRINDNGSFPYLRTHPLTSERMGDMQARLQLAPSKPAASSEAVALEHALIATRARLLADPSVDHLRSEVAQAQALLRASAAGSGWTGSIPASPTLTSPTLASLSSSTSTAKLRSLLVPAQLYGGALAALKQRDLPLAQRLAEAALTALAARSAGTPGVHDSPAAAANPLPDAPLPAGIAIQTVQLLQAEIALAQNNPARARALVLAHVHKSPVPRPVLLLWAQTSSAADTPAPERQKALDALQLWVAQQPQDAPAWEALAGIYTAQKQPLRAIRALAEARVAVLDYTAALDRYKAGQELAKSGGSSDYIELSIIDARARAVQALQREFASDKAP